MSSCLTATITKVEDFESTTLSKSPDFSNTAILKTSDFSNTSIRCFVYGLTNWTTDTGDIITTDDGQNFQFKQMVLS